MVRNTQGGSGHKSQARKLVSSSRGPVRTQLEEGAHFAMVFKLYGNGMCQVIADNGEELLCHIRGKFRGRNKSNNIVSVGSLLMVGLRDFSTKKECDLLEVYDVADVRILKSTPGIDLSRLDQVYATKLGGTFKTQVDDLEFTNDIVEEPESDDKDLSVASLSSRTVNIVDFDDI
jgi:initiation factor 1A